MDNQYEVTLPVPPSINRMYRVFRGRVFMVKEGKDYKALVHKIVTEKYGPDMKALVGPVAVELTVFRPAKRGDLDNFMKVLLDGLQGTVYKNDKQIVLIIAKREDSKQNPRVQVIVRAIQ